MPRWSRSEQAAKRLAGDLPELSERQQAEQVGVARTTLQYWRQRQAAIQAPAAEVAFFETAEGIALLHRLLIGAHFAITLLGCGGVRLVCQFLEPNGQEPGFYEVQDESIGTTKRAAQGIRRCPCGKQIGEKARNRKAGDGNSSPLCVRRTTTTA